MVIIAQQYKTGKLIAVTGKVEAFIKAQQQLQKKFKISPKDWDKYVDPVIDLARETMTNRSNGKTNS